MTSHLESITSNPSLQKYRIRTDIARQLNRSKRNLVSASGMLSLPSTWPMGDNQSMTSNQVVHSTKTTNNK